MHVGVLDELVVVDLRLHLRLLAEEVVRAVHLPRPRLPGGVAHREPEPSREVFAQHVDQGALVLQGSVTVLSPPARPAGRQAGGAFGKTRRVLEQEGRVRLVLA